MGDWLISLACLNPWLGTRGPNGEQRQKSTCPIVTHPPVKAIMGNTERHSFNFIFSTEQVALHNVIISGRSAGSSDRAMLSRRWGNANWFHISLGIFKTSTFYTDCHFRQRYENQREMSNCIIWNALFTLITGSWNKILLNATLSVYNSRGLYYALTWTKVDVFFTSM